MIKSVFARPRRFITFHLAQHTDEYLIPYEVSLPWHLISIHDFEDGSLPDHVINNLKVLKMISHISLEFMDITPNDLPAVQKKFPKANLFEEIHAKRIIDFITPIQNSDQEVNVIVHCAAGVSRSGAVASFVNDFAQLEFDDFKSHSPNIYPNGWISATLSKVWRNSYSN